MPKVALRVPASNKKITEPANPAIAGTKFFDVSLIATTRPIITSASRTGPASLSPALPPDVATRPLITNSGVLSRDWDK